MKKLSQLSASEKMILVVAVLWNVATMWVMVYGRRPDWALLMIMPYAMFTFTYSDECDDSRCEVSETED
jgi:hypothetical protein